MNEHIPGMSEQTGGMKKPIRILIADDHLIIRQGLRLTPEGEKLYAFAQSLLSQWDNFKEELNEIKGAQRGTLRLAAPGKIDQDDELRGNPRLAFIGFGDSLQVAEDLQGIALD